MATAVVRVHELIRKPLERPRRDPSHHFADDPHRDPGARPLEPPPSGAKSAKAGPGLSSYIRGDATFRGDDRTADLRQQQAVGAGGIGAGHGVHPPIDPDDARAKHYGAVDLGLVAQMSIQGGGAGSTRTRGWFRRRRRGARFAIPDDKRAMVVLAVKPLCRRSVKHSAPEVQASSLR